MVKPKVIATAAKLARQKSRHTQHRHAVLIMRGNLIVATGWNGSERHAEIMALTHAYTDAEGADAFSIRVRKSGLLGMARPCPACMQALKLAGIRRVQYSTNDNGFITEEI